MLKKRVSIKSASIGFIIGAVFFSGVSYAAGGSAYKIVQNGIDKTPVAEDLRPLVQNGRVYVPVRTIADLLDVSIGYDNASKTVTLGEKIVGTRVKNVASYEGNIRITYPNELVINGKHYKAPSILLQQREGKATTKLNLDGKYKSLIFSLGMDDKSIESASMKLVFKDDTGKVINEQQIGYGGLVEGIKIDVTNVLQLVIESEADTGVFTAYAALINPILQ
ncbi:stalk domain-containing protein [Paenibacillus barengoltzii]|uniref:stalk domain-containing protein n=1 Tax=Paenibacillus barengoltzii TaxID=343517 RepID=UPI003F8A729D